MIVQKIKEKFAQFNNIYFMQGSEFAEIKQDLAEKYPSWQEGLYCLIHDIATVPTCKHCSKPAKFQSFKVGYSEFCSRPCSIAYTNKQIVRKKKTVRIYNKTFREFEYLLDKQEWDTAEIKNVLSKFDSYSQINQDTNPLFPKLREQLCLQNDGFTTGEQIYLFINDIKETPCCKHCGKKLYGKMKSHTVGFGLYCDNICHGKDVKLETGYKLTPLPLRHLYGKKIDETTIHEVLNFVDIETLGMYGNSSPVIYEAKQYVRKKYPNAQSIAECLWLEEHGYSDVPRCVYCDELLVGKFISSLKGYFATCSTECSVNIRRQKYDASGKLEQKIKTAELDYSSTHVQCLDRIKKLHLFRHDICGTEYETVLTNSGQMSVCPKCKENNISRPHQAVLQFCKDNYAGEIEINNRKIIKPLELDILIPKLKLAIEVDGVYWHQEESSPQQKKKLCLEKGINLLHISDFEWRNNRSAWENILLSKLKKQKRLFARKCSIKEISTPEARAFCEKHHFQRYASASVHLGLFYLDELVAYMSFGKPRFTKKYDYELIRFCSQSGLTVVGGASKLFKYFINQYSPNSIVSYANANYSNGNLYRAIGMTYSHFNDSSYVYIRGDEVLTRYACQKHKLSELLGEQYDSSKTERDNMLSAGYVQFFDRGTFVFTYQK